MMYYVIILILYYYYNSANINRIRRDFINERVMLSWNKLPSDVKMAPSLNMFKTNLKLYKNKARTLKVSGSGNFWDQISDYVLNRNKAKKEDT